MEPVLSVSINMSYEAHYNGSIFIVSEETDMDRMK